LDATRQTTPSGTMRDHVARLYYRAVIPPQLAPFLQPDRAPYEREGGLHDVLRACFAIDARIDGTGPMLDYASYELVDDSGHLSLQVTLRLSWWTIDAIEDIAEQPLALLAFVPDHGRPYPSVLVALDREPDEVVEHITSLVLDRKATATSRLASASRDVTPAELVFE
jgi:hypothetical protein